MRKIILLVVLVAALLHAEGNAAEKVMAPNEIDGATVVTSEWVRMYLGSMMIFDVREKADFASGHIVGAVSAPYRERSKKSVDFRASRDDFELRKFPRDREYSIIVHCEGPRSWKSYKAAVRLVKEGYKNVYWYRDGMSGWRSKGFPLE